MCDDVAVELFDLCVILQAKVLHASLYCAIMQAHVSSLEVGRRVNAALGQQP
jgi:hypothetical protein